MQRRLRVCCELPPRHVARRRFQQQHRRAGLARHQRGAQRGVAAADHQHIDHAIPLTVPKPMPGISASAARAG
jgi:hypothetical protein